MSWRCSNLAPLRRPWPEGEEFPGWYVRSLESDIGHLRWGIFVMSWSIVGWCAKFDRDNWDWHTPAQCSCGGG